MCMINGAGDCHIGYFGFRANNTTLKDNRAMNVVIDSWKNITYK